MSYFLATINLRMSISKIMKNTAEVYCTSLKLKTLRNIVKIINNSNGIT